MITEVIGGRTYYKWSNMWPNMTPEEIAAYEKLETEKQLSWGEFPWAWMKSVCNKWGLTLQGDRPIPGTCLGPHYLVSRYLEEHPRVAKKWRSPGHMYFDILRLAEEKYLGLEREAEKSG